MQKLALAILFLAYATVSASAEPVYADWVAQDPARPAQVAAFEAFLSKSGVRDVLPTDELLLNASFWHRCKMPAPWSMPPPELWPHVAGTLALIRDTVVPKIGAVDAVSGYRDDVLNPCAGGAPKSAHRHYFALDLVPRDTKLTRAVLIDTMCQLHAKTSASSRWGLGFYGGTRFHVDTQSYRLWGANGHRATSPCLTMKKT